jgi:hypothetical protein
VGRYVSDPIELAYPRDQRDFAPADLTFDGVDQRNQCFEARIFFNNPDADETTPLDAENGYAGSFVIFGHGGCAGDEGHCEIPEHPDDTDDLRLPHPLHPATKPVVVTDALRRIEGDTFTITVVPVLPGTNGPRREDVLFFDSVDLLTYE